MNNKRTRQLVMVMAIAGILLALGLLSLISTLTQWIAPLTLLALGGFAFYKIALQGRGEPSVMADEVAESSTPMETAANARLSAVEQARQAYIDRAVPAEEILEDIQSRKGRLQGDDPA